MMIRVFAALTPLLLISCGGGGDAGGGTPPAANAPPVFTSLQTASVAENSLFAYQATGTDPDGDALIFTIDGGADAERFSNRGVGEIEFRTRPDYELPGDADGDNVYNVRIRLSDDKGNVLWQTVNITVTNSKEGITVKRVGTGFNQPVSLLRVSESSDVYVIEKGGTIYRLNPSTGVKTLFFTVGDLSTDGEGGLLNMAGMPNPAISDRFLIYCTNAAGDIEIRLYGMVAGSRQLLDKIVVPHPGSNNHYGGAMNFADSPDGLVLYVGTGDGGGAGDPMTTSQNPFSRLGKILRIKVPISPGSPATPLAPAPGNPYINGGGDPYVWAMGLRNPFSATSEDIETLTIGDVGQGAIEELNILKTENFMLPVQNFGWPYREGTQPYAGTAPAGLINPVLEYGHGTGPRQGRSIIAGYRYASGYVFGDFISGNIWTVRERFHLGETLPSSSFSRRNEDFQPDIGTIDQPVAFRKDFDGNLFIVDFDGDIFMVTFAANAT